MGFCRWLLTATPTPKSRSARSYWRRRSPWLAVSTFALLASAKTVVAEHDELSRQRIGNGDPVVGKQKAADERCQECHGEDGNSGDVRIPSHAGQYAGYLVKQLSDFKSGARSHEIMNVMAADLTQEDMADIAAYFASQKVMRGERIADNPLAKNLFLNGDAARDLPACASCHGENGKGKIADNVIYPVIGGQRRVYLRSQLTNWKLGERKNSPEAVMTKVAKSLNDDELNALVEYLSGL